jgi:creatinine amidohydrolase/Fe(II)-dependent formamide hydrolase-like protein
MHRRLFHAAFCLLVAASALPAARAQSTPSDLLEELTWTELSERIHAGSTTIIVPVGGTEQNGPAMVLGKHNVRVKALSARIAAALGHTLVAPVIAYVPEGRIDPPTAHMRFAGTISVPDAVFEGTLEAAARSFRQHGFHDIVFLGDHGGYQKNMVRVAEKLNREWAASPVRAHAVTENYRVVETDYAAALKRQGFTSAEIGTHAGLADTALSLAVDPRIVRAERLREGAGGAERGVYGDPARASAQAGQLGVELIVSRTVAAIRQALARR